jgi:5-methyltetrahydropteroyltriglutamate--homocysteine methyltransferase
LREDTITVAMVSAPPFADDTSTSRDIAFAKVRARVEGTALAAQQLGL